jgi:hypothetical protein
MTRLKTFIKTLPAERTFLAALLGALSAWLLREAVTGLLFAGKTFAGRAQTIQILILAALFLIAFGLLLIVLGRLLDWLIEHAALVIALLALVPLAAYALMGSFSRFVSDDFASAALATRLGVWGGAMDWYLHWTGRFSANLADSLTGYLGQRALAWQTGIVVILWLAMLAILIRQLIGANRSRLLSLFLATLLLTATFATTPDLPQSLYWAQGMHSLILPLIFATLLAALFVQLWIKPIQGRLSFLWITVIGLLAFIAGGFGETYVSLQTFCLALLLFFGLILRPVDFRKKLLPAAMAALLASIAAMAVIIASPGNQARQAFFPPAPSLPAMLWIALEAFASYLVETFTSAGRVGTVAMLFAASILAGSGFLYKFWDESSPTRNTSRNLLWLGILTAGSLFASFVPSAYGMSAPPPGRTLVIPTFILAAAIAAAGYLVGRRFQNNIHRVQESSHRLVRIAGWAFFLIFTVFLFSTTSGILYFLPEYSRFALVSDRADEIIWQAKAEGLQAVEIPEVHNHFGLSDFGVGTNRSLDDAVYQYYGIRVIINKNLNKHIK